MSTAHQPPTWLVAYDFSSCSRRALDLAARELDEKGGRLVLFHAYDLPYVPVTVEWPGLESPITSTAELERALDEESHIALQREAKRVAETYSRVEVEVRIGRGPPADAILLAAKEVGAERVVIGTHGRKGLSHLLLGSVAERVVRVAEIPVLVVKSSATGESSSNAE